MIVENVFAQFLVTKFREWEKAKGGRQSLTSFARYLGVKQPTLTRWMQGDNVPDAANLDILARRLGNEVYDILGYSRPKEIAVDQLPVKLRERLDIAIREISETLISKGIEPDSELGTSVTISVLKKYGFDVRDIE